MIFQKARAKSFSQKCFNKNLHIKLEHRYWQCKAVVSDDLWMKYSHDLYMTKILYDKIYLLLRTSLCLLLLELFNYTFLLRS